MMKKRTTTQETRKALQCLYIDDNFKYLDEHYTRDSFIIYVRNDRELNRAIYHDKHSKNHNIWNVILTTLNYFLDDPTKYYTTADQVRRLTTDKGTELVRIAAEVLKSEEE